MPINNLIIISMKKVKAIFVDIDWTLYDHKYKSFDFKSVKALHYLQTKGVKIIVVTSRPLHSAEQLGLFNVLKADGFAFMNGAYILLDDEEIYQYHFPKELLKVVVDKTIEHNLTMELSTKDDRFLIAEKNDYVDYLFSTYQESMPPVIKYDNQDVVTSLLFAPKEYDEILKKEYPKQVAFFRFDDYGVDIAVKKHSKGEAVKLVKEKLHLRDDECMAFGDDIADISMFKEVSYPIALANAKEEVKKEAIYVTKPVWKHGIYFALKKYRLLPLLHFF